MIYNLHAWLKSILTNLVIIVDGIEKTTPSECCILSQSGGTPEHWMPTVTYTIQLISRSQLKAKARKNMYLVYNEMLNRFGITLPATTVDGDVFPLVKVAQISPMQLPGYIGTDDHGNHMYSVNFIAIV